MKSHVLCIVVKLYIIIKHFVVQWTILMQDIWRTGTTWNEPITELCVTFKHYRQINEVNISRCFLKDVWSQQVNDILIQLISKPQWKERAEADVMAKETHLVVIHRKVDKMVNVQRSDWNRLLKQTAYVHRAAAVWNHLLWRGRSKHSARVSSRKPRKHNDDRLTCKHIRKKSS